jgi:Mrp family chromosome partitioning ATPase
MPVGAQRELEAGRAARREEGRAESVEVARQEAIKLVQRVFLSSSPRRTVLFAGVEGENGCAGVCLRAGEMLARLQPPSVCVVDANLRTPPSQRAFGTDDQEGLAAAVVRSNGASGFARRATPDNLWLLPSGSASSDPDLLLTPDRVRLQIEELRGSFDHLVINAPPINLYAESLALSQFVDGVVLVLEAHSTRREIVWRVKTWLDDLNLPLVGIVLNSRTLPIPDIVYRHL